MIHGHFCGALFDSLTCVLPICAMQLYCSMVHSGLAGLHSTSLLGIADCTSAFKKRKRSCHSRNIMYDSESA